MWEGGLFIVVQNAISKSKTIVVIIVIVKIEM